MIPVGRVCAAAAGLQREQGVGRETTCALECALLQLRSGMRWYREERHREDAPAPFEQPVLVALGSPVPPRPILSSTCLPSSLPPSHQLPPLLHGSPFCLISSSPSPPPPPFQSAVETELLAPSCPFLCLHSSPLHTLPTLSSPPNLPFPPQPLPLPECCRDQSNSCRGRSQCVRWWCHTPPRALGTSWGCHLHPQQRNIKGPASQLLGWLWLIGLDRLPPCCPSFVPLRPTWGCTCVHCVGSGARAQGELEGKDRVEGRGSS